MAPGGRRLQEVLAFCAAIIGKNTLVVAESHAARPIRQPGADRVTSVALSTARKTILVGLILFVGFVVYHALVPYGWSGQTNAPAGVAPQDVSYTCGAPFGQGYVHGPATTAYPLNGRPCGERADYQIMTVVDVVVGALGIGAALAWRRSEPVPA